MPSTIVIRKKLDMTPGAVPTVVHRSQYDSDFTIIFELFARTGEFVIESGTTARLRGTKTSGTGYSVEIPLNISTKTVTITGDAQMTVAAGENIFEVVLYQGDLEICSSNFVLAVERAAMDADTITDATVVPELEHLEEYTQQAAEQAAQSASTYAESWAVGGTGTREGEDTNNAKYWSEQAQGAVTGVTSFNGRTGAVVPETGDYKSEMIRRGNSTTTVEDTLTSLGSITANLGSRMTTAEGTISSQGTRLGTAESDIDDLETRATTAEGNITSQGTRLSTAEDDIDALESRATTAESDIDALETRATTAESNITTLQSTKVDMTTPLLNFDDTAVDPTTDDGALANALRALDALDDVISSGGGALYLKKVLTEALEKIKTLGNHSQPILWKTLSRTNVSQASGPNYWTMGAFPAITGYTRFVLDIRPSNNNIVATRWEINASNNLLVYTYNLSTDIQTFDINAYVAYIKSSEQG